MHIVEVVDLCRTIFIKIVEILRMNRKQILKTHYCIRLCTFARRWNLIIRKTKSLKAKQRLIHFFLKGNQCRNIRCDWFMWLNRLRKWKLILGFRFPKNISKKQSIAIILNACSGNHIAITNILFWVKQKKNMRL